MQKHKHRTGSHRALSAEAALEQYENTDTAAEIATAIDVMRRANETRQREVVKLLQRGPYHRIAS